MKKVIIYEENPESPAEEVGTNLHAVAFGSEYEEAASDDEVRLYSSSSHGPPLDDFMHDSGIQLPFNHITYYGQPFDVLRAECKKYFGGAADFMSIDGFYIITRDTLEDIKIAHRTDSDVGVSIAKRNALMIIHKPKETT